MQYLNSQIPQNPEQIQYCKWHFESEFIIYQERHKAMTTLFFTQK